jgi:rhamnose utilization protein RhaD (predicted bifunctional aldolase and dehydrogenase)
MDKALSQLIRISHAVGKDSLLVQGGGGNTSVKTPDGRYMYIKASGTALKDMSTRNGWRRIRLNSVLAIIGDKSIAKLDTYTREIEIVNRLQLACDDDIGGQVRPSVEAHLHGFLDKCVIHLTPASHSPGESLGWLANTRNSTVASLRFLFSKSMVFLSRQIIPMPHCGWFAR